MNTTPTGLMSEQALCDVYENWTVAAGLRKRGEPGDAEKLLATAILSTEQRAWLYGFCDAWSMMLAVQRGIAGVEITRLQLGHRDLCRRIVTVRQHSNDLYTVTNWQEQDGERSATRTQRYTTAADALKRATDIAAEEIADICDTLA